MAAIHSRLSKAVARSIDRWRIVFDIAAGVGAVLTASLIFMIAYEDGQIPIDSLDVHIVTPEVDQGGELHLVYTNERYFPCTATIVRFLRPVSNGGGLDSRSIVRLGDVPGGYSDVGVNTVHVTIALPEEIAIGEWSYVANIVSYCGDQVFTETTPQAYFTVVEQQ